MNLYNIDGHPLKAPIKEEKLNLYNVGEILISNGYLCKVLSYDLTTRQYILQAFDQPGTKWTVSETDISLGTLAKAKVDDYCHIDDNNVLWKILEMNGETIGLSSNDAVFTIDLCNEKKIMNQFETGAKREHKNGKGAMHLVPWEAIIELSKHFEEGAVNHGPRNWEKGIPLSSFLDSGMRHPAQYASGDRDYYHLRAWVWNALCFLQTKIWIDRGVLPKELDDLPVYVENSALYMSDELQKAINDEKNNG